MFCRSYLRVIIQCFGAIVWMWFGQEKMTFSGFQSGPARTAHSMSKNSRSVYSPKTSRGLLDIGTYSSGLEKSDDVGAEYFCSVPKS